MKLDFGQLVAIIKDLIFALLEARKGDPTKLRVVGPEAAGLLASSLVAFLIDRKFPGPPLVGDVDEAELNAAIAECERCLSEAESLAESPVNPFAWLAIGRSAIALLRAIRAKDFEAVKAAIADLVAALGGLL